MSSINRDSLRLSLTVGWLLFTVSFAIWWFKLSSDYITLLMNLQPDHADHWLRQKRMVYWEGIAWIVLLTLGGVALIFLAQREKARARQIKEFFASFSHEIKTSLASLRLQAETLLDETSASSPVLHRLVGDTVRLQVQLENSLFFASQDNLKMFMEPVSLTRLVERLREQWPTLKITLDQEALVRADDRALRTIFSNLLQNALVHGQATQVSLTVRNVGRQVEVVLHDDGMGCPADRQQLGRAFYRPAASSGSGLGLYIARFLAQRMNGDLQVQEASTGFKVLLRLAEAGP